MAPRTTLLAAGLGLLLGGGLVVWGCGEGGGPARRGTPGATKPADRTWTPTEVADDPEGYLAWADGHIRDQVRRREEMLASIASRRGQVEARRRQVVGDLDDLENFRRRLETAYRRADDEGRWPVQVGTHRYEQERAKALLEELPRQIDLRRPLAQDYDRALADMDGRTAQLRGQLASLGRLKERVALDAERVQLNKGAAELAKLSEASAEIAHFSKILVTFGEAGALAPASGEGAVVPLDVLLK